MVAMTGFFAVGLFPYDLLQNRLVYTLSQALMVPITVGSFTPMIPAGLAWHDIRLGASNNFQLQIDHTDFTLDLVSVLRGRPRLRASVQRGAGVSVLSTELELDSLSAEAGAHLTGQLKQIELPPASSAQSRAGLLNGNFSYQWDKVSSGEEFLKGKGTLDVEMTDIAVVSPAAFPGLVNSISRVHGVVNCSGGVCRVIGIEGEGAGRKLTGEGTLVLHSPVQRSVLATTLWLTTGDPQNAASAGGAAMFSESLTVRVNGPLNRLRISL